MFLQVLEDRRHTVHISLDDDPESGLRKIFQYYKTFLFSNFLALCQIKSNDETQIQMQNRNTDFICPNQFKEVNEASNESEVDGNHTDGSSLQYLPV